jgi:flavin-dependent dehydrogenase
MSDVVVLGAGLAGLWSAAAAAGAGARVLLLDRDEEPEGPERRAGVPQGAQPHVLLHRGLAAGEELLPGLHQDLLDGGAVRLDTGVLPWLGEHGWLRPQPTYDVVSLSRPLFEHLVRERLRRLGGVEIRWGVQVRGLDPSAGGWRVSTEGGTEVHAPLVVDATGRSSRLRRWLADLGVSTPEPAVVDARLGYATQVVEGGPDPRDLPGVVVQATPSSPVGGLALPVEGGRWLVSAVGFGERRPPRDPDGFAAFLAALPDPAVSAVLASGNPVGEVAVHRQTANRRHRYARMSHWPDGLLAVGDALCCFDPVYGQGITVSACQALRLRSALRDGSAGTRRLLRTLDRTADFPWAVAIGQDVRMPSSSGRQSVAQAAVSEWATQLGRRAVQGDARAHQVLMGVYHLESSPLALLHPALVASVVLGRVRREPVTSPRPEVLDVLGA